MIYFSADLHFSHNNIIKYCNRPCTIEDHDSWIMCKFDVLKPGDTLYLLGDITCNFKVNLQFFIGLFTSFKNLNVTLYILLGNHDEKFEGMMREAYQKVFGKSSSSFIVHYLCLRDIKITEDKTVRIVMSHYPFGSWDQSHRGSINLHGHCHGTYKDRKKFQYDVGLDVEHKIFSLDDIIEKYIKEMD